MTPQELKNSILQLAIQGKLVEQRAEEGTGRELLEKILAAKNAKDAEKGKGKSHAKSAKSAKCSGSQFSPISDDEKPFDIPDSWEWVRLGELVFNHGQKKPTDDFSYIDIGSIDNRRQKLSSSETIIHPQDASPRARKIVFKGDVLYATVRPYLHNICIIDREFSCEPIASTGFAVMACTPCLDNKFLFYFLLSPDFDRYANSSENAKGVAYPAISDKRLYGALIPLPPLAEQKRIVAKIEELLPLIDRYEKAWSRLESFNKSFPVDMQKSILQMAIQGKLVEQRAEEGTGEELYHQIQNEKQRLIKSSVLKRTKSLPAIHEGMFEYAFPETWKLCYIDDIAFVTKLAGFEYTEYIAPNLVSCGVPLFKGKNVQNGKVVLEFESFIPINISDSLPRSQIRKKCLLTPYVGTIGNIAIFDGGFRAHLGSNVGKIELLNSKKQYVLEEYVLYYLRSAVGYSELTKYKKATAQESISIDAIRNVIIPIPPIAEQKRIVAKLEELLPLCERLK